MDGSYQAPTGGTSGGYPRMVADRQVEEICLVHSLNGEWLKLPLAAMRLIDSAVQTLAGIRMVTNSETFVPAEDIARAARLPLKTVRRHLAILAEAGLIENKGRGHTRGGMPRRTNTIALPKNTRELFATPEADGTLHYGILPWWACCTIARRPKGTPAKLPWSARALLSIVMARLCSIKAAVQNMEDGGTIGEIEEIGNEDRFRFSLCDLMEHTGLSREGVVAGKHSLMRYGIVNWSGGKDKHGGQRTDSIAPNWNFRVRVRPASEGSCWIDFVG